MKSFLQWLDEDGFLVKQSWDMDKQDWTEGPGKLQLFPFQREILGHVFTPDENGRFPYSTIVYSTLKKCMGVNERMWLSDGSYVSCGDLIGKPFEVWAYDGHTFVPAQGEARDNGVAHCYEIVTQTGRRIIRTDEHPLMTWDGWVPVKDLCLGDSIAVPRIVPEPIQPEPMSRDLARFLGYMIAEGCFSSQPRFSQQDGLVLNDMRGICLRLGFGFRHVSKWDYSVTGANETLRAHGIWKKLSHEHEVPQAIFQADNGTVIEFLSALIDGDGWICDSVNGSTRRVEMGLATNSRMLVEGVAALFARFGLYPQIHRKPMPNGRFVKINYQLVFTTSRELLRLVDLMKLVGKADDLLRVAQLAGAREIRRYPMVDIFPKEAWHDVFEEKNRSGLMWSQLGVLGSPIPSTWALHRVRLEEIAFAVGGVLTERIAQPFGWDKIVAISDLGDLPTVAITVPGYENYLTNFVEHNSGKTAILAAILAWAGECAIENSELFSVANDMEQAQSRAFADVQFHVEKKLGLSTTAKRIRYENGTYLQVLANQYSSAAGSRQFLSTFDELWGYSSENSRRMWAEMTPPPSVKNSMRVVATYAGFESESEQLMDLYNLCFKKENGVLVNGEVVPELAHIKDLKGESVCRRNGKVFVYWDTEPRMPWQNSEYYEQEMMTLRPSDFLRMHRNKWVSSNETFIPIELWDRACKVLPGPLTLFKNDPRRAMPISIGIDIGTKYDTSALVGTYYDAARRKVGLAFHHIWTPPKDGQILDLEMTVERELLKLWQEFKIVGILYDPTQFQRSAVSLKRRGLPLVEVPQQGSAMIEMTQNFYDLLRSHNLEAYPDEELRDHVRYATAEHTPRGFRLRKDKHAKYAIDAAQALAMAAYDAVNRGGIDTSVPLYIESPFSDSGSVRIPTVYDELQMKLPEALRS